MERNFNIEKLRYQENKFAFTLALLAFLVNQVYLVKVLNGMPKDYNIGIEIFINLAMYLVLFLGMERVKNHHKNWSITFMVMGGLFFTRVFYIPRMMLKVAKEIKVLGDENSLVVAAEMNQAAIIAIIAVIVAGLLILISGIHGYKQSETIKSYYEKLELN